MDGAALLTFLKRRLAESGLSLEADRDAELLDYLTQGRDDVLAELADEAPLAVRTTVTLDDAAAPVYTLPAGTPDPYRLLELRDSATGESLEPSVTLNQDAGHYRVDTPRTIRLADAVSLSGQLEGDYVLAGAPIDADTAEADIGLPTTCHRAIGLAAAVFALTADEESDATVAAGLYQREITRLKSLYGNFDFNDGLKLRHGMLATEGDLHGDMLS
jgi:hypothetical protein